MKTTKQLLYEEISTAREGCAGSNVQSTTSVVFYIEYALKFALEVCASQEIIDKLNEARKIMKKAVGYGDRLPADQILCDILNKMDNNEYPELEVRVI